MLPRLLLLLSICTANTLAQDVHVRVSPESKGSTSSTDDFPTIQMAMDHAPETGPRPGKSGRPARLFLHIAPGTYRERVAVTQNRANTTFLGEGPGPAAVVITASMNARLAGGTFFSETVRVDAPGFEADNLTFENNAGDTGQAVALAIRSDRAVIKHCRILGHQDTLFADFGRQYFLDTYIEGTVDFIFGNAAAVFDRSEIHELSPGYLTAQSRTGPSQNTGFVILHSRITSSLDDQPAAPGATSRTQFFLGRPWRAFSRAVVMESDLPRSLAPELWSAWKGNDNDRTAFYAVYRNHAAEASSAPAPSAPAPSAPAPSPAPWTHQLTSAEARHFLPSSFLAGPDHWNAQAEANTLP